MYTVPKPLFGEVNNISELTTMFYNGKYSWQVPILLPSCFPPINNILPLFKAIDANLCLLIEKLVSTSSHSDFDISNLSIASLFYYSIKPPIT